MYKKVEHTHCTNHLNCRRKFGITEKYIVLEMENFVKEFDAKIEEVCQHMKMGMEDLFHEMDGAMFQFIVEEKSGVGKERTQRALRRVKAVFLKGTMEIKEAKKHMVEKIREFERRRRRLEEERHEEEELSLAVEEAENERERRERFRSEEVQTEELTEPEDGTEPESEDGNVEI